MSQKPVDLKVYAYQLLRQNNFVSERQKYEYSAALEGLLKTFTQIHTELVFIRTGALPAAEDNMESEALEIVRLMRYLHNRLKVLPMEPVDIPKQPGNARFAFLE